VAGSRFASSCTIEWTCSVADGRAYHSKHDLELVAAWAAGEATGPDLERAERLLDACDLCVVVARDLRAITLALQELPAVEAMPGLPAAPRDFRLTAEQAARLRSNVPLVQWTDRLVAAVVAFGRPVGASLAALGFVGLLVGATSLGFLGGGAAFGGGATSASSAPMAAAANPTAAPAQGDESGISGIVPAATAATGGTEPGPKASDAVRGLAGAGPGASAEPTSVPPGAPGATFSNAVSQPAPATWLLVASVAALVAGVGLIVIATRRG
jgi:hypothetical protein